MPIVSFNLEELVAYSTDDVKGLILDGSDNTIKPDYVNSYTTFKNMSFGTVYNSAYESDNITLSYEGVMLNDNF